MERTDLQLIEVIIKSCVRSKWVMQEAPEIRKTLRRHKHLKQELLKNTRNEQFLNVFMAVISIKFCGFRPE